MTRPFAADSTAAVAWFDDTSDGVVDGLLDGLRLGFADGVVVGFEAGVFAAVADGPFVGFLVALGSGLDDAAGGRVAADATGASSTAGELASATGWATSEIAAALA